MKKENNNGPAPIKDLSQLGSMLKEAQQSKQLPVTSKSPSSVIQLNPDDDVLVSIWTVMSDHKGRNVNEVERVLEMHTIPTEDVPTLMRYLHNAGCLNTTGRPENPIYTLKKGAAMPGLQENTSFRQRRIHTLAAPVSAWDPEGKVDPEEGLDCCIWKLTRDRKPRTIIEIGELLNEYGFAREVARNRVISLANNKNWYDRIGKSTVTYAMKKGIKMPTPENAKNQVADTGIKINSTTTHHTWEHKGKRDLHVAASSAPVVSQSNPAMEEVMKEPVMASTTAPQEDLVVRKGDDWDLAIWKTMHDFKEYTAAEIGILLSDFGFNPASTATRISTLYLKQNWFERSNVPGSRAYKYRLKESIARPASTGHNVAMGKAQEPLKQDELPNIEPAKQEAAPEVKPLVSKETNDLAKQIATDMASMDSGKTPAVVENKQPEQPAQEIMTQTNTTTTPPVEHKAPQLGGGKYLKFVIQIKSISMTVDEARKLHARLKESGYGKARVTPICDTNDALFAQTITIKGTVFPASQVQEIALELEEFGFGDDENFES